MSLPTNVSDKERPICKAGDFDFLSGNWKIHHRQLKSSDPEVWDVFEGEATCWSILNGMASIEELRIPARNFSGMGLRTFNTEKQIWSDFWMNAKNGILLSPGVEGFFQSGQGIFVSEEKDEGQTILVRGMWDNISTTSCRWQQASSRDAGKSWQTNWMMDWRRV